MPAEKRISIIGCAFYGTAAFINLLKEFKKHPEVLDKQVIIIDLIDQNADLGPGPTYDINQNPILTINDNARALSLDKDKPLDFVQWLESNKDIAAEFNIEVQKNAGNEITLNDYWPPRALFGRYCKARLGQAIKEAEQLGIKVFMRPDTTAEKMLPVADGWQIFFKTQEQHHVVKAQHAVLTTGHLPSHLYTDLKQHPGYFHSPFPPSNLAQIPAEESVAILGKRLTAVDATKLLWYIRIIANLFHERHSRGTIYLVSPSLDPLPPLKNPIRTDVKPYQLQILTPEVLEKKSKWILEEVVNLFNQEIRLYLGINTFAIDVFLKQWRTQDPKTLLQKQIHDYQNGVYQKYLLLTDQIFFKILPLLSRKLLPQDLLQFFEKYYGPLQGLTAPLPYKNAEILANLMEKEELKVYGGLEKVEHDGTHFVISFKEKCHETIRVKNLINAIGDGRELQQNPLLQQLYRDGLIASDMLGGVAIDPVTQQVLNKKMQAYKNLFCSGPQSVLANIAAHSAESATIFTAIIASNIVQQLRPQTYNILHSNPTSNFWNEQNSDKTMTSNVSNNEEFNQYVPASKL